MNKRNHGKYFMGIMKQKSIWSNSLKTEDKVLLGIALFVGASAIILVTVGNVIWNNVRPRTESQRVVQEAFDQFDQYQDEFSQSLKRAMTIFEENHEKISEAHSAHMKHLGSSVDNMQDTFDDHMEATRKQMDANWHIIKEDALKRIKAPMVPFNEVTNMKKGQSNE